MSLVAAYIVPHPPLAVPEVGRGQEAGISATLDGYKDVAERIASIKPDTIFIISPHTAYYADWIYIAPGSEARGSLAQFRAPEIAITLTYDKGVRAILEEECEHCGIPAGPIGPQGKELDHGMLVPLYYIDKVYPAVMYDAVSIGGSALPREQLLEFGRCIARAAQKSGKKCVLLVSGDLSHKLTYDGPYGFDPAGPVFDDAFVEVVKGGDPVGFARLDEQMCEDAAECGLSGFVMMAGALEEATASSHAGFTSELISHEGPFGVGYGIAAFERKDDLSVSADGECVQVEADDTQYPAEENAGNSDQDPLVALATKTINEYITNRTLPNPPMLPSENPARAGCFVSIHTTSTGELRGCIGTIEPVQDSLAEEIIANAVSASTRDPRFPAISALELDDLSINVDVLFAPEPSTLEEMDPKRYGIIVTQGYKRGLLLPDLEGVDTVEEQFRIACMKAGIDPFDALSKIQIERFEVVRHE